MNDSCMDLSRKRDIQPQSSRTIPIQLKLSTVFPFYNFRYDLLQNWSTHQGLQFCRRSYPKILRQKEVSILIEGV